MTEEEEIVSALGVWADWPKRRRYASDRIAPVLDKTERKQSTERCVVDDFLVASSFVAQVVPGSLKSAEYDPPDALLRLATGESVGIEVVELVSQEWVAAVQRLPPNETFTFKVWEKSEFHKIVRLLVEEKTRDLVRWRAEHDLSWLLIYTCEPDLCFKSDWMNVEIDSPSGGFDRIIVFGQTIPSAEPDYVDQVAWGEVKFGGGPK